MPEQNQNINQLSEKLENLLKRQIDFSREINELRAEIVKLKMADESATKAELNNPSIEVVSEIDFESIETKATVIEESQEKKVFKIQMKETSDRPKVTISDHKNFEKFIGENLISKIGIVITIIGVAIGAKYSIEHDLISPLTRIILGYLVGLGLLGFGIKLKAKYENYSAVLVSGAMTIMYFITFAAYAFYNLFPQVMAFALMVFFTIFTVVAAINYNKQIIAHIGLVGAYAVPFLLSDGSGKVLIMFSYMAVINIGILVIAFKKYWKSLYYSSFGFTWLIFFTWFVTRYHWNHPIVLAFTFLTIFFLTFYAVFLAYKLMQKEQFNKGDIILLLSDSFIFYGLGYQILSTHETGGQLLGIFTLINAIIHFGVGLVLKKQDLADKNLFYLVVGLVLVFITIAVPVQLEGNWVTIFWAGEAALLFWIGRTKNVPIYEMLSYPMMLLAFWSLGHDWQTSRGSYYYIKGQQHFRPIFNVSFLSSMLFITSFAFIHFLNRNKKYVPGISRKDLNTIISIAIPAILLLVIYNTFRLEITRYGDQLYDSSGINIKVEGELTLAYDSDYDINKFTRIWVLNYSFLFLSILSWVNIKKIKNNYVGFVNLGLIAFAVLIFLTQGMNALNGLNRSYFHPEDTPLFQAGVFNIAIRYISYAFLALVLVSCFRYIRQSFLRVNLRIPFDAMLHLSILWITSYELMNVLDIYGSRDADKLGMSILWGLYALFLISLGIWKKQKHLRIGAIALFAITLVKLFVYDLRQLDTIGKTVVFVSLGILLLIISFLYNKYKHLISHED